MRRRTGRRHGRYAIAGVALAALTAGCGNTEASDGHDAGSTSGGGALPSRHVHAVALNPGDKLVYLATHDGLFRYGPGAPERVGPVIDLMGFSVAGPDHFYASGHPGPGVDLPQPLGLIESTDGGRTWSQLSRQGQSDFHSLAVSDAGIVGSDGTLRATSDGENWRELDPPAEPYTLAVSPDGEVLLGTSESGLMRSEDAGAGWATVPEAPQLMLVDWAAGDTVVGITPDGTVAVSRDAGVTWTERGAAPGRPQALGAAAGARDSDPDVLVVTENALMHSTDGGVTFGAYTREGSDS